MNINVAAGTCSPDSGHMWHLDMVSVMIWIIESAACPYKILDAIMSDTAATIESHRNTTAGDSEGEKIKQWLESKGKYTNVIKKQS